MYRFRSLVMLVFVLLMAFASQILWAQEASMAEKNKAAARRIPVEMINQGKLDVVGEIISENFVNHSPPPGIAAKGHAAITELFTMLRTAFPDIQITLDHEIAEGDYVVHHATVTGTHKGDFMGHAATDKKATWKEIHILQFEDGKAVAHWGLVDMMDLMMQLGVMPQPETTKK